MERVYLAPEEQQTQPPSFLFEFDLIWLTKCLWCRNDYHSARNRHAGHLCVDLLDICMRQLSSVLKYIACDRHQGDSQWFLNQVLGFCCVLWTSVNDYMFYLFYRLSDSQDSVVNHCSPRAKVISNDQEKLALVINNITRCHNKEYGPNHLRIRDRELVNLQE